MTVAAQYLNDPVITIKSNEAQWCQAKVSFQVSASTSYQRRNGSLLEETEASVGQKGAIPTGFKPSAKGPEDWFTGIVRIDSPFHAEAPPRFGGARVTFEPGARCVVPSSRCLEGLYRREIKRTDKQFRRMKPSETVSRHPAKLTIVDLRGGGGHASEYPDRLHADPVTPNIVK